MFTGLIEALGAVQEVIPTGAGRDLVIEAPTFAAELALGESVAVNGCCLTVVAHDATTCRFQAGPETVNRTNLGELRSGYSVNLERSLRVGDRLGGHIVQGHIDGVGRIDRLLSDGDWVLFWFTCPPELAVQMVSKGSVAVDGVSLTLVDVEKTRFSAALIPHTLAHTTFGSKKPGDPVNLETDLFGKYIQKYLTAQKS